MDDAPPPLSPDRVAPAAPKDDLHPVTFTGSGGAYFKIWIVNVSLTILTLGIFSAWAKVRRLQYFHRHTHLAGASFDFHGEPIAILKGRIVGGALFLLYSLGGATNPLLTVAAFVLIAAVMPWMLRRSFRFRLRNTSYRGLRFDFMGTTRTAYWAFLLLPIASVFSAGLLAPYCHHQIKRYQFDNTSYGSQRFAATVTAGPFYTAYLAAALAGIVVLGVFMALIGGSAALESVGTEEGQPAASAASVLLLVGSLVVYLTGILAIQALVVAKVRNALWNALTAGPFGFTSTLRIRPLAWMLVTNLVATIATLGLFWPFAQVRLARFFTQGIAMTGPADFGTITASPIDDESAVGDEVAGFFDIDVAF